MERYMERAGFGIRFLAYLIDGIIFGILSWIISFVINIIFPVTEPIDPITGEINYGIGMWIGYVISFILGIVYFVWIPRQMNGQTFGKKMTRIRIVKLNDRPLTFWTLFLREYIGKLISAIILFIGYLMVLGRNKRALHDYIAGTLVVRED